MTSPPIDDSPDPGEPSTGASADASAGTTDDDMFGIPYRWVAMGVVLFGVFMVVLDTTVVNLGLPSMQEEFDLDEGVEWVVTSYLAAVGVSQMCSGWLADRFGRRSMFIWSMTVFTVASLLCAISISVEMLVASRVLQGVGGGIMMPVAMAMIYELFDPEERGRAMGYFGIAVMAAPAIGPVLGGALVSSLSWHWLFLINIPIGIVGIPIAMRLLRDTGFRESRPFDSIGLALSGVGLTAFLIGMSQGGIGGWGQPVVIALLAIGVGALALFVWHAGRTDAPLVQLRIMTNPVFAIAMVCLSLMAVAQYSRLVYIPLELGSVRDVNEFRIGLVMLPSALGMAMTMPLGGRMVDRVGARIPVTLGISILAISFVGLASFSVDTPLPIVSATLFLGGFGSGFAMMSPNIIAMNSVAGRDVSQASGLASVTRQVSAAIGVAILASIFATVRSDGDVSVADPDVLHPYRTVFIVGIGLLVACLIAAQFLPGKERALRLQADRRAEMNPSGSDAQMHAPEAL